MNTQLNLQSEIQAALCIDTSLVDEASAHAEIARRVAFIKGVLIKSAARALVLGISGGVDSSTAGRLCQLAVDELKAEGKDVRFVAVRLPYKTQADEADAQAALSFINADVVTTVNIAAAVDGMMSSIAIEGVEPSAELTDFAKGNVKARSRMLAQYAIANYVGGLVVGTDHAAEAVMGFFTKFGDGACDLAPLSGLTKGQVRLLAKQLGAPAHLVGKAPTADLEDLDPCKLDEVAYGCTYDDIDNYLLGKPVPDSAVAIIEAAYIKTAHKRELPIVPG
ncbi:ammonia-dependent NAD(+) synthetase [Pseudomonas sp. CDFA 602]|uniref:ammonia-dependent NAD(+) synthetase n=1 Tax=Pseudomonas californiensis TaxID=2829823 RepID=UPI001E2D1B6D|nr:ammonia-dependent NAD(+) synthetase [Pseudomonas californiensis]MCD5993441.1 ammonia-dependent NAD(+) synthetase [Pseudomonas californiensis]MCD5999036.1 ammonia-dependent NAD(+) synthetase [Pseudomonas californiensis]